MHMQLMVTRWIVTTRRMTIIRGELERDSVREGGVLHKVSVTT